MHYLPLSAIAAYHARVTDEDAAIYIDVSNKLTSLWVGGTATVYEYYLRNMVWSMLIRDANK